MKHKVFAISAQLQDSISVHDDFGFLWFEDEYTISVAARWIVAASAADAIVR
jgi:hypothetical protein